MTTAHTGQATGLANTFVVVNKNVKSVVVTFEEPAETDGEIVVEYGQNGITTDWIFFEKSKTGKETEGKKT